MVPNESTALSYSFEQSHIKISSTDYDFFTERVNVLLSLQDPKASHDFNDNDDDPRPRDTDPDNW